MNAAIYCRVSTMEQASEGYSIQIQKEKLTQYAQALRYTVRPIYSDEGFSGKSLSRPAMLRMLGDVKAGLVDIVLIYKLDRLSRRVKDVLDIVELFDKYNVTLYSLNENIDLSSPFGRAALKMSATFSELERETIVERMQMGKDARANEGKYTVPGLRCPFGYRHDKKNDCLVVDEKEAEVIKKIFDLYINCGYTFRKLYKFCKSAYPNMKAFNNPMCCKPLIERPLYAGYFLHKGKLIKGSNFPPIISYETFLKAQAAVAENRKKRSFPHSPNLLAGLIICGKCGNRYVGKLYEQRRRKNGGEAVYKYRCYGCAARVKRDKKYTPAMCDNPIIPADVLDEIITNEIKKLSFFSSNSALQTSAKAVIKENRLLEEKKKKLLDLYIEGIIDKDSYLGSLARLDLKAQTDRRLYGAETSDELKSYIETLNRKIASFDCLPREQKANLLKLLIKKITVDGKKITIFWNLQI